MIATQPNDDAENQLPQRIQEMLRSCPTAGAGVHSWLIRIAVRLHRFFTDKDVIFALLEKHSASCGRPVEDDEIWQAIENSATWLAGQQGKPINFVAQPRWPEKNEEQIEAIAKEGPKLAELESISPVRWEDGMSHSEEVVDILFPGDPLLCAGTKKELAITRRREEWRGFLAKQQFVCASPMTAIYGKTKNGKASMRCVDNVGPRRFVVVECDSKKWEDLSETERCKHGTEGQYRAAKFDEQAGVLWYLTRFAPLAMMVHSAGKSLHGWYFCEGQPEALLERFMRLAVSLGADHATWTRCQFVRMPDGTRDNGKRQRIIYFNPQALQIKT
jgi:hypothetical protein